MNYSDDEKQYKEVITVLKQLPKVNAPSLFEADLMRKINSEKFETKESFFAKYFIPKSWVATRLIPSAALAVAAVIMLFIVDTTPVETDDPLSLEPRVREDLIQSGNTGIDLDDEMKYLSQENQPDLLRRQSSSETQGNETASAEKVNPSSQSSSPFVTASSISKSGLNFRQVNLTEEERIKLNELKERFKQFYKEYEKSGR